MTGQPGEFETIHDLGASPFDVPVDRRAVAALKFRSASMENIFGQSDLFPSWVADMDFKVAPPIIEQLRQRAAHGVFGYEYRPESLFDAIIGWFAKRHAWDIEREQVLVTPNVLNAIAVAVELFTAPRDGVIVQPPVFFDFKLILKTAKRRLVKNPLTLADGVYGIDFDDLEAKVADPANKMLIVCNPHNPIGRVWSADELRRVAELCVAHDVLLLSDDIHADIVLPGHRYTPVTSLSPEIAANTITCLSPAKSFNLAACCGAFTVIADPARREAFAAFESRFEMNKNNAFANVAMQAAYRDGGPWLDAVLDYIQGNVDFIRDFVARNAPGVSMVEPQGTFMVWMDFRELGLDARALQRFIVTEARWAVNMGHWFGREGAGFARLNVACPRPMLEQAMRQLADALANRTVNSRNNDRPE